MRQAARMVDPDGAAAVSPRPADYGRRRVTNAALAVAMVVVVPFAVTGLFRLGFSTVVIFVLCLAAAGALAAIPRSGPWLAAGWLIGCALWAVALVVILRQLGEGLERIG